jgi:hypothetical protein
MEKAIVVLFGVIFATTFIPTPATAQAAAPPTITSTSVSQLTETSATLEATVNPNERKVTDYHFEYIAQTDWVTDGEAFGAETHTTPVGEINGSTTELKEDHTVSAPIAELTPGTAYRFRLSAKNGQGTTPGEEASFRTFAPPPVFGPCANDALRARANSTALPDCRAYEQASPTDKDGGDVTGAVGLVKAAPNGGGITFGSASGLPGGVGAQSLSVFMASRGNANWSPQGLLPPETSGQRARVLGLSPGYDEVFSAVTRLGNPRTNALLGRPVSGDPGDWSTIGPYVPNGEYDYAGEGGGVVAIESSARLADAPAEAEGHPNVYAYDKASGELTLASVSNEGTAPVQGAFAGPYDWVHGTKGQALTEGGAARDYYTQATHAIAADGSGIYFTEAGTGRLFLRLNPTAEQSAVVAGKCTELGKACTLEVSASQASEPDPAGQAPAAFMAASEDGSKSFFTSSEELTDDANTGPKQPVPSISRSDLEGHGLEAFIEGHRGVGVAVDSKHIYWASPTEGTIGRAELDGSNPNDDFIVPGEVAVEEEKKVETAPGSGEFETVIEHLMEPSRPRWVAVDSEYVYWSNAPDPKDGHGTIGRAKLVGEGVEEVEPEFIKGRVETSPGKFENQVGNPQGIAVNAADIYWANGGTGSIARATIGGAGVEPRFYQLGPSHVPEGVALSPTGIYWGEIDQNGNSYVVRIDLNGSNETFHFLGNETQVRGVAVDGSHVYWASQQKEAIGRISLADFPSSGTCAEESTCELEFIEGEGALNGLAVDSEHLYWTVNGESAPNPGNDLYRFDAGSGNLEDLAPDSTDEDGAEVQGVLGVSADGTRAYFVANAVLAAGASPGTCHGLLGSTGGSCSLYLWEEGQPIRFVAPLDLSGDFLHTDAANWAGTPTGVFPSFIFQKTARLTPDGETLLFRSQEQLSEYDNEGKPELYLYRAEGGGQPLCVSCDPSNAPPRGPAQLNSISPTFITPPTLQAALARNLSEDGRRVFFETTDALLPEDTNGEKGCPPVGSAFQQFPACLDVYEWEANGEGSCESESEDGGCLYLISTGKSKEPSLFGDASASGDDVFFFTRDRLVGQDGDGLFDVYDARAEGGLAAQSPAPEEPCLSVEACHFPPETAPAQSTTPGSEAFVGPGNPTSGHHKARKHKRRHRHHKHRKHRHAKHRRAGDGRGARR